jgi:predicted ATPase with chaperone activity
MESKECKDRPVTNGVVSTREFLDEQISALKELSDTRFKASETAVNTALATQEKAVNAAFLASEKALTAALQASEKAISKAETIQAEVNKVIGDLTKDVISLRESRSQGSGKDFASSAGRHQSNFNTNLAISIGFNVLMFLAMVWKMLLAK